MLELNPTDLYRWRRVGGHGERAFSGVGQKRAEESRLAELELCFGNRSAKGELATARLLTVADPCDLQRLNILAYLSAAIVCHRRRQSIASLVHR